MAAEDIWCFVGRPRGLDKGVARHKCWDLSLNKKKDLKTYGKLRRKAIAYQVSFKNRAIWCYRVIQKEYRENKQSPVISSIDHFIGYNAGIFLFPTGGTGGGRIFPSDIRRTTVFMQCAQGISQNIEKILAKPFSIERFRFYPYISYIPITKWKPGIVSSSPIRSKTVELMCNNIYTIYRSLVNWLGLPTINLSWTETLAVKLTILKKVKFCGLGVTPATLTEFGNIA